MSINLAMNIAMKSLMTNSTAIGITNHNIANMNDPYYSKQLANISATTPISNMGGAGQIGTGSQISAIERIRDLFLNSQIQSEMSNVGKWTEINRTYQLLSALIPEVNGSTNGLQSKLDKFFADWQSLADAAATGVSADIAAARAVLYSDSTAFTTSLNSISGELKNIQLGLTTDLKTTVDNINQLEQQIYIFNKEIRYAEAIGQRPNDMLDKRNEALTKLAGLINIETINKDDGTIVVHVNGHALVNGGDGVDNLMTIAGKSDTRLEDVALSSKPTISISNLINNGTLGGILQSRDAIIKPYKDQLDELASGLISTVNKISESGDDGKGLDFFLGFKADTIMVNPALQDPTKINYKQFGSNDLAEIMANLGNKVLNTYVMNKSSYTLPSTPVPSTTTLAALLGVTAGLSGKISINSVDVQYNTNDTIAQFVNKINSNVKNFSIVFNETSGKFFMFGNDLLTVQEEQPPAVTGGFLNALKWNEVTESAAPINSASSPTIKTVLLGQTWITKPPFANYIAQYNFNTPADYGARANGVLTVTYNGSTTPITWHTSDTGTGPLPTGTLTQIANVPGVSYAPNLIEQKIGFYSSPISVTDPATSKTYYEILPITLSDKVGNMTKTLNLPGTTRFGTVYATIVGQVGGQLASSQSLLKGYQAAVDQYQNMQTEITHVNAETELANAKMYQRSYDASVKLMEVIDEMLNLLINRTGTSSSSLSGT